MFVKSGFNKNNGLAQIPLMVILLFMAVAIPVATSLVKQNQDVRNRAAYNFKGGGGDYGGGGASGC